MVNCGPVNRLELNLYAGAMILRPYKGQLMQITAMYSLQLLHIAWVQAYLGACISTAWLHRCRMQCTMGSYPSLPLAALWRNALCDILQYFVVGYHCFAQGIFLFGPSSQVPTIPLHLIMFRL